MPLNPDCYTGKHHRPGEKGGCSGDAWDNEKDEPADCSCWCHQTP